MKHRTVEIRVPITVDEGIAPLIQECWRLGAVTRWCCEGDWDDEDEPSYGYISFAGLSTAEVMVNLIRWIEPRWPCLLEQDTRINTSVVRFHRRNLEPATMALRAIDTEVGQDATFECY